MKYDNYEKFKRKQEQPLHHAGKTKTICQLRRKQIIKSLAAGKTQQEAGELAGLSPNTAQSQVSQILMEPNTQRLFKELIDAAVSDNELALKYKQLLEATKIISAMVMGSDGGSMTRDFIEVADCAVQLKCADSIAKLKGYLNDKNDVNFNLSLLTDKQLQEIIIGKTPKDVD